MLNDDACYTALESRDPRFDGRFYTGVVTTGIYCRPICPARTPRRRNVRFYASAAAAAEDGFRACRRCRPEAAPGSPARQGTSAAVSRALGLIA
ncbi:MAG: 3-methyladenine DNA glycosylase 2, partial [Deltaproteobacteria bacterium]|nr:3-methyladenine DNA glycosylase 2 [Deltaproteobacteria bacterium]